MVRLSAFILLISICANAYAQKCQFEIGDPGTFREANQRFHDVLAPLQHGPVQEGNVAPVREQIGELITRRDAVMQSRLSSDHRSDCAVLSSRAMVFSKSVDELAVAAKGGANDQALLQAFAEMHDAYRSMQQALTSAHFLIEQFHAVLHPLWHEAYPENDVEAIKAQIPKLQVRSQLILNFAKARKLVGLQQAAVALVDSALLLERAAADDDFAVLVALEQMHDAFHAVKENE